MICWRHYCPVGLIRRNGGSIFLCLFLYSHWLSIFTYRKFQLLQCVQSLVTRESARIWRVSFFLRFTIITLHLNDAYCKGTIHPGRGTALQTKSERVFAATSAVFCWSHRQETTFFILVCSEIDCAFFTEHRHNDKTQSPFVVLWVIMTLSFLKKTQINCKNDTS